MKVLVTGSAGFIGSALSLRLLARGDQVIGIDCLNDYYDVNLKKARLARTADHPDYVDLRIKLEDRAALQDASTATNRSVWSISQHRRGYAIRSKTQAPTSTPTWSVSVTCWKAAVITV